MTEKFKILAKYIKDMSSETPDIDTYLFVKDNISNFEYPMPFYSKNQDEVFVGRIRKDFSQENSLNMWIVADNLRKGAATNAVQIAEKITKEFF